MNARKNSNIGLLRLLLVLVKQCLAKREYLHGLNNDAYLLVAFLLRQFLLWKSHTNGPLPVEGIPRAIFSQMKDQLESCLNQIQNSESEFDLFSGADLLIPVHLKHLGKLDEAVVIKLILDAQVVAVCEVCATDMDTLT